MGRGRAASADQGRISRPRRAVAKAGGGGTARHLPAARNRSPGRHSVCRSSFAPQALDGTQEARKGATSKTGELTGQVSWFRSPLLLDISLPANFETKPTRGINGLASVFAILKFALTRYRHPCEFQNREPSVSLRPVFLAAPDFAAARPVQL